MQEHEVSRGIHGVSDGEGYDAFIFRFHFWSNGLKLKRFTRLRSIASFSVRFH